MVDKFGLTVKLLQYCISWPYGCNALSWYLQSFMACVAAGCCQFRSPCIRSTHRVACRCVLWSHILNILYSKPQINRASCAGFCVLCRPPVGARAASSPTSTRSGARGRTTASSCCCCHTHKGAWKKWGTGKAAQRYCVCGGNSWCVTQQQPLAAAEQCRWLTDGLLQKGYQSCFGSCTAIA